MTKLNFEKQLDAAVASGAMTTAGRDWLTLALDPEHHKNPCTQRGYPDGTQASNLVRTINEQETFTLPEGVDGTWTGLIFSLPELCQKKLALKEAENHVYGPSAPKKFVRSDGVTPVQWGLFNAVFVPGAGAPVLPTNFLVDFVYPAGTLFYNSNHSQYCTGLSRLVGGSFKVCNTSTVTNLGGSGTAFRVPAAPREITWTAAATDPAQNMVPATMSVAPPSDITSAYRMPGSVAFDLKDGIYMPLVLNSPPTVGYCRYQQEFLTEEDAPNTDVDTYVKTEYDAFGNPIPLNAARSGPYPCTRSTGTDVCGAYLTGLTTGMQFSLFMKTFIETFPSPHNPDITFATKPPPFDDVAWELYCATAKRLPVYATFDANDSSMWWNVVCAAGMVAARVIPNPLFGASLMIALRSARLFSGNGRGRAR